MKKRLSMLSLFCSLGIIVSQPLSIMPVFADSNFFVSENTFIDTVEYAAERVYKVSGNTNASVNNGVLYLKGNNSTDNIIPRDESGNPYTIEITEGNTYKFLLQFDYKYEQGHPSAGSIYLYGAFIDPSDMFSNVKTSGLMTFINGQGVTAPGAYGSIPGARDGQWYTAAIPMVYTATEDTKLIVGLKSAVSNWHNYYLDNIQIIPISSQKELGMVYLKTNGGNTLAPITGCVGDEYEMPKPSKGEDFSFAGWYTDAEFSTPYDGKFPVNGTTLYAKWDGDDEGGGGVDTAFTDTIEYDAERVYKVSGNGTSSVIDGALLLKGNNSTDNIIPRDENGRVYTFKVTEGNTYKFLLQFDYYYADGHATAGSIYLYGAFIDPLAMTSNVKVSGVMTFIHGQSVTAPGAYDSIPGGMDGQWHTASIPMVYTATADTELTIGLKSIVSSWHNYYLDNIQMIPISADKEFGTVYFETNGGNPVTPATGCIGDDYKMFEPYKSEDTSFAGWYTDAELTTAYDGKFPDNGTKLYAKWEKAEVSEEAIFSVSIDDLEHDALREFNADKTFVNITTREGEGVDGSRGSRIDFTEKGQFIYVPKGENASFNFNSGRPYKFIVKFKYKYNSGWNQYARLWIYPRAVNADTGTILPSGGRSNHGIIIGPFLDTTVEGEYDFLHGSIDDGWHTAYMTCEFVAASNTPNAAIGLYFENPIAGSLSIDDLEIYRVAPQKDISIMFLDAGNVNVNPVLWVAGEEFTLPDPERKNSSFSGWFTDEKCTIPYTENVFPDKTTTVYGEFLTENGFYAEEHFDNNEAIWESVTPEYYFERYGLKGKMRNFEFSDEVFHDSDGSGRSLKYDRDGVDNTEVYSQIILTNNIDNQIYISSAEDDPTATYIVSFYVKCEKADSDLRLTVGGCSPISEWETNTEKSDTYTIPVLSKFDWQKVSLLLTPEWLPGTAGSHYTTSYLCFILHGVGTVYIDDFEITKLKSNNGQTLHFDTNGGTHIPSIAGEEGTPIDMPDDPKKEGYVFGGWFYDLSYEEPFTNTVFDDSRTTYLFAKWDEDPNAAKEDKWGDMEEFDDGTTNNGNKEPEYDYEYIYEDIYEEYEVPYNRKKIVLKTISQKPVNSDNGISILWIIIIISAAVIIAATVIAFLIFKKRKKHSHS